MITIKGKPAHRNAPVPPKANNVDATCAKCGRKFKLRDGHICCLNCMDGDKLPEGWQCSVCGRRNEVS